MKKWKVELSLSVKKTVLLAFFPHSSNCFHIFFSLFTTFVQSILFSLIIILRLQKLTEIKNQKWQKAHSLLKWYATFCQVFYKYPPKNSHHHQCLLPPVVCKAAIMVTGMQYMIHLHLRLSIICKRNISLVNSMVFITLIEQNTLFSI